ncbi:MAG: hypothetical protein RBR02_09440 [Desulfuromonadaceae bacterium]|nr:hypothetical protein [Desulfuromonadaceae bacterium]
MNTDGIIYPNEKKVCSINSLNFKSLLLTDQRLIFLEYNSYQSIHLENIVSVRYTRSRKIFILILAIISLSFALIGFKNSSDYVNYAFIFGTILIIYYFISRKSFIEISTKASEKIKYNVKVADPDEIRNFCG